MNNRGKRLEYIKNKFNLVDGNYCEECFIVSVISNSFAMDFVRKEIDRLDGLECLSDFCINDILKYNLNVIYSNSYKKLDSINEVLIYMAYAEYTQNLDMIIKLIKKSHSQIYKMIADNKNYSFPSVKDGNIMAFISSFINKEFASEDELIEVISDACVIYFSDFSIIYYEADKNIIKDIENKFKVLFKKFQIKKSITFKDIKMSLVNEQADIFRNHLKFLGYNEYEIMEELNNNFFGVWETKLLKNNVISSKGYKLYRVLSDVANSFAINYEDIADRKLEREDIINILGLIKDEEERYFFNSDDAEFNFILITYIYLILKDSVNKSTTIVDLAVKLDQNKHENFINNRKTIDENSSLKEETRFLKQQLFDKNKEIEELKKKLNDSNAKINALKNEKSKIEDNKEELIALRELFFSLENTEPDVIPIKNVNLNIDSFNIAFIGGSDNLQLKVKELFPSFAMVSSEEQTRDLSFLKNMNYVFLHTHMPHSLYYKVVDILRINNINFCFLNEVNVDILSKKIINKLS